ncbi:MAG TPA: ATP-binding protein [Ramlibacter sp.]|uniref:ATP-binding protein n=1 Tax=Ramlibacter sp. TaxID=1917967 RepID=UPI002ED514FD
MTVQPTLPDVARAVEAWQARLPERLSEHDRFNVAIALAEVLTNIVEHGYAGLGGPAIDVAWSASGSGFVVEVRDAGQPIPRDRLDTAGPSTTFGFDPTDIGGLPEGGMGLGIVKTAFDHVAYSSKAGVNRLRLGKRFR